MTEPSLKTQNPAPKPDPIPPKPAPAPSPGDPSRPRPGEPMPGPGVGQTDDQGPDIGLPLEVEPLIGPTEASESDAEPLHPGVVRTGTPAAKSEPT